MRKSKSKYKRCKKCGELVVDVENCAVCENRDPLAFGPRRHVVGGKKPSVTLDMQEGNSGAWGDRA